MNETAMDVDVTQPTNGASRIPDDPGPDEPVPDDAQDVDSERELDSDEEEDDRPEGATAEEEEEEEELPTGDDELLLDVIGFDDL